MKTAVEWLLFELSKNGLLPDGIPSDIHNKAKEMEKEQIISVYWDAYNEGKYSTDKTAEEYYKEIFKEE